MKVYKIAQEANPNYSPIEGKNKEQLHQELMAVFKEHKEYHDIDYGNANFMEMVQLFAQNESFPLHLVAREYQRQVFLSRPTEHTCPSCGEKGSLVSPHRAEGEKEYESRVQRENEEWDRKRRLKEQREKR